MKFSEFDLEEAIWNDYLETGGKRIVEAGLPMMPLMKRQLKLGNYGIADLIGFSFDTHKVIDIYVYELKANRININTLDQAVRYAKGVSEAINETNLTLGNVDIILVGSEIDKSGSLLYIPDLLNNISMYETSISVNGLSFNRVCGYSLIEPGNNKIDFSFSDYRKLLNNKMLF